MASRSKLPDDSGKGMAEGTGMMKRWEEEGALLDSILFVLRNGFLGGCTYRRPVTTRSFLPLTQGGGRQPDI